MAEVGTFRNTRGSLGCRLFHTERNFPDEEDDVVDVSVPVAGPVTRCEFRDVPPGTYAIVVIHDENGNGRLDRNFLGFPTEGYGVSNNRTHALRNPVWGESAFRVGAEDLTLTITLRY